MSCPAIIATGKHAWAPSSTMPGVAVCAECGARSLIGWSPRPPKLRAV